MAVWLPGDRGRSPNFPVRVHDPELATRLFHLRPLRPAKEEGPGTVVLHLLQGYREGSRVPLVIDQL